MIPVVLLQSRTNVDCTMIPVVLLQSRTNVAKLNTYNLLLAKFITKHK